MNTGLSNDMPELMIESMGDKLFYSILVAPWRDQAGNGKEEIDSHWPLANDMEHLVYFCLPCVYVPKSGLNDYVPSVYILKCFF